LKKAWPGLILLALLSACSSAGSNGGAEGTAGEASDTGARGMGTNEHASAPADTASGVPAASADSNEPVKLVVATYYLSEQVQAAVKKYETLHPNIDIELHATSTTGEDLNDVLNKRDQFIETNNTALLAGSGPDLIELDELPSEQYVERHLLIDLNGLMKQDPDFHREQYFTNVIDHLQTGGGLYGMPLYFSLVGLFGDADAIGKAGVSFDDGSWTLSDFIDTARQLKQKGEYKYVFANGPTSLLNELVAENYAQLVTGTNGNAKFDADALADMMQQVKTLFDEGLLYNFELGGRPATAVPQSSGSGPYGNAYFFETELYSLRDAVMNAPYPHTKMYVKPHPAGAGDGGYFRTFGTLGINASSAHPKEAWDFVKFLLGDESVQSYIDDFLDASPGFPMNRSVYEQQKNKLLADGTATRDHGSPVQVDPALIEQVDDYLAGAVHSVGGPSKLEEIVDDESKTFFAGQKSAEAAAKLIANKINLLLNE
jgi:multiple sugar transport system substrate-binding protein